MSDSPSYLIAVETSTSIAEGTGSVDPEQWYAGHAEEVRRIAGVVRVERYWSHGEDESTHLALYHVTASPEVMSERFADAKAQGQLSSSPFPNRTMRSYRLRSVLAD